MRVALVRTIGSGILLLAVAGGCSDDDPEGDPVKQCNTMVDAYCSNVIDCQVEGDKIASEDRDAAVDECKAEANAAVDCAKALGVSESYDDCIARLEHPDCDAVNQAIEDGDLELPSTCEGVIGIQG